MYEGANWPAAILFAALCLLLWLVSRKIGNDGGNGGNGDGGGNGD